MMMGPRYGEALRKDSWKSKSSKSRSKSGKEMSLTRETSVKPNVHIHLLYQYMRICIHRIHTCYSIYTYIFRHVHFDIYI